MTDFSNKKPTASELGDQEHKSPGQVLADIMRFFEAAGIDPDPYRVPNPYATIYPSHPTTPWANPSSPT